MEKAYCIFLHLRLVTSAHFDFSFISYVFMNEIS